MRRHPPVHASHAIFTWPGPEPAAGYPVSTSSGTRTPCRAARYAFEARAVRTAPMVGLRARLHSAGCRGRLLKKSERFALVRGFEPRRPQPSARLISSTQRHILPFAGKIVERR
jgi:hypothetical protein